MMKNINPLAFYVGKSAQPINRPATPDQIRKALSNRKKPTFFSAPMPIIEDETDHNIQTEAVAQELQSKFNVYGPASSKVKQIFLESCQSGESQTVKILLGMARESLDSTDFQQLLNAKDEKGNTGLNIICDKAKSVRINESYKTLALELVNYGADPDIKNNKKLSARDNKPFSWGENFFVVTTLQVEQYNSRPTFS